MRTAWLMVLMAIAGAARAEPPKLAAAKDPYHWKVSRVVDAQGTASSTDVEAALRATGGFAACAEAETIVVAWLAFEQGKVALVDVGGTDDRAIRTCLIGVLGRAKLASDKRRVVAIVEFVTVAATVDRKFLDKGPAQLSGILGDGPRAITATMGAGELEDGSPSGDDLDRVLRARGGVFRACYQRELNRTPELAGTVRFRIAIADNGSVSQVDLASSTMDKGDDVVVCLATNLRRLKFPAGHAAMVIYPMVFARH
ncbi:MAG: AgmX/PglI C-terminal domain-containing protein [Kofleriaceae bacterium]